MRRNHGFTLMELMVVIAVIIILAGFLTPALSRARKQARKVECMNNLKQLSIAFHSYALDYSELFPSTQAQLTGGEYLPAGSTIFQCPASNLTYEIDTNVYSETASAESWLLQDASTIHPSPGRINVLYVDGHVASQMDPNTGGTDFN